MKQLKKMLLLAVMLGSLCTFCACGNDKNENNNSATDTRKEETEAPGNRMDETKETEGASHSETPDANRSQTDQPDRKGDGAAGDVLEDIGNGVEDGVNDVIDGVEDAGEDMTDGGRRSEAPAGQNQNQDHSQTGNQNDSQNGN